MSRHGDHGIDADDHAFWQEAVRDVTPLANRQYVVSPPAMPPAGKLLPKPLHAPPPPRSSIAPQEIERRLLERIAKGREAIEARLDLHDLRETEAHRRLEAFIHQAYGLGIRTALIITGKGRAGEGVLRRALPLWLEGESLRGYISGYHPARPVHGGSGAWYVRIAKAGM